MTLAVIVACDLDGDTFQIDLVNDTEAPLQFVDCNFEDCDPGAETKRVDPGEHWEVGGVVDVVSWFLVKDDATVLGCFKLDFDERPSGLDLLASEVQACP